MDSELYSMESLDRRPPILCISIPLRQGDEARLLS